MKQFFLTLFTALTFLTTQAKEGMWLPFLLETLNEKEMKAMGMKITAKDLYNEGKSSWKDAVCIFGSGCTGEVISREGLVLTNHHCGYGTVQGLSSLQNDYLKNGFWAMNNQQELPCPGLSVTFIEKIVDVTTPLTAGLSNSLQDTIRQKELGKRIDALVKENTKNGYGALVKSFFNENKYYLFITVKYTDVRLVGFPPNGIGKFGGDTDNWAWPRHTGDFSVFRIYTDSNNKPAAFNVKNKPYKPKKFFSINIGGVKKGDFTMVYGFPGRTQQNLTSGGVKEVMEITDPTRIKIREARLQIMDADMRADRKIFIQYASKQSGIANAYKKWKGELLGLRINNAIDKKLAQEKEFTNSVKVTKLLTREPEPSIISTINATYPLQKKNMLLNLYLDEAAGGCEAIQQGAELHKLLGILQKTNSIDSITKFKPSWDAFYKNYSVSTDKKISFKLMELMQEAFPDLKIDGIKNIGSVLEESVLPFPNKINELFVAKNATEVIKTIETDKGYLLWLAFNNLQASNFEEFRKYQLSLVNNYHYYVGEKLIRNAGKPFYPDANSTLRVSYGKVEGVTPEDGKEYNFYTTLDGAIAKNNPEAEEFEVPTKLLDLYKAKDFGNYATANGKVPIAFLASNHTTGGNSGSPVLNAKGQLIGTNFDRIWEGTMSDIYYDINLCRNITLDVRYTLFIIEKFGGAGWLLKEMDIVKK